MSIYHFRGFTIAFMLGCVLCGCESIHRSRVVDKNPGDLECPAELKDQVVLSLTATSLAIPEKLDVDDGSVKAYGMLGRRLMISILPTERVKGAKVLSSVATISTFGGTLRGWAEMHRSFASSKDARQAQSNDKVRNPAISQLQSIEVSPGRVRIVPFLQSQRVWPETIQLDLLVIPGGGRFDEMTVETGALWKPDGAPIDPKEVEVRLAPIQHLTVFDFVEALVELDVIGKSSAFSRVQWKCSFEGRGTIVDRDSVRPPLWDLGIPDSRGNRVWWLALKESSAGTVRAIFTNPASARGFSDWLMQTGATGVGKYQLELFQSPIPEEETPNAASSWVLIETSRPVRSGDDLKEIRVGRIAEP